MILTLVSDSWNTIDSHNYYTCFCVGYDMFGICNNWPMKYSPPRGKYAERVLNHSMCSTQMVIVDRLRLSEVFTRIWTHHMWEKPHPQQTHRGQ